jgi:hypothetical protein
MNNFVVFEGLRCVRGEDMTAFRDETIEEEFVLRSDSDSFKVMWSLHLNKLL